MVMCVLESLLSSCQYSDVAAILESLDGPLTEQPESTELWLYLVLGHLYNHQWCGPHVDYQMPNLEYARFAMNRAPAMTHLPNSTKEEEYVQESNEFKAACNLVKIVWNREYALAWGVLGSDVWTATSKPFVDALATALRNRVATDMSQAYSSISIKRACDLLGVEAEALSAECEKNTNWSLDRRTGLLRIARDFLGIHEDCDLSELHSITEQMIALS